LSNSSTTATCIIDHLMPRAVSSGMEVTTGNPV